MHNIFCFLNSCHLQGSEYSPLPIKDNNKRKKKKKKKGKREISFDRLNVNGCMNKGF